MAEEEEQEEEEAREGRAGAPGVARPGQVAPGVGAEAYPGAPTITPAAGII